MTTALAFLLVFAIGTTIVAVGTRRNARADMFDDERDTR